MVDSERNPWDAPEDETPPRAVAAPEPTTEMGPAPASAGPDVTERETGTQPDLVPEPRPDLEVEVDPNRNRVVFIALSLFAIIAVVGFLVSRGGDSKSTDQSLSTPTTSPAVPTGSVSIKGTSDSFTRPDNPTSLGAMANGTKWNTQNGVWGIEDGKAYVATPDPNPLHRNVAWVATGFANGQVRVKITTMVPQAGIVFRYSNECSYWSIESSPKVATWNIVKVEKCVGTQIGNTGYARVENGVTIGVQLTSSTINVVVDGKVVKVIDDDSLAGNPGRVGLMVTGQDAAKVRFGEFIAGGPKGQAILTTAVSQGESTSKTPTTTKP